jgi:hypothetical protein
MNMIFAKRRSLLALAATGWLALGAFSAEAPQVRTTRPEYNEKGELLAPRGFRAWVFAGADNSPEYRDGLPESARRERPRHERAKPGSFHNIYINPEAYRSFLETGKFPDPTILVMEVFRAEHEDAKGVLQGGEFEGKRTGFEVAVKDRNRPGGGVPWAYYAFDLDEKAKPSRPARAKPDASCYQCHLKHASVDNVWVQFYPALRDPE